MKNSKIYPDEIQNSNPSDTTEGEVPEITTPIAQQIGEPETAEMLATVTAPPSIRARIMSTFKAGFVGFATGAAITTTGVLLNSSVAIMIGNFLSFGSGIAAISISAGIVCTRDDFRRIEEQVPNNLPTATASIDQTPQAQVVALHDVENQIAPHDAGNQITNHMPTTAIQPASSSQTFKKERISIEI